MSERWDRYQRTHPWIGFPLSVVYKFFDDSGNYLAAIVTYYAFIAIFPLLLLGASILGFFLRGNEDLQNQLLNSALSQFPIIGNDLKAQRLHGSTVGVIVGAVAATYGALGLGQAIQNTVNIAWSVPKNSRFNPIVTRLRSLVMLATAGLALLIGSILATLATDTKVWGTSLSAPISWALSFVSLLLTGCVLTLLFRMATTREHPLRNAAPGAFFFALSWLGLQWIGAFYVEHVIRGASGMNKDFGFVLGLMVFIYLAAIFSVIGVEINVVLARRLWPRALLTPFTDKVDLTDADRRAYASYVLMQRHKGFQTIAVSFDGRDGTTYDVVMDPTWMQKVGRTVRRRTGAGFKRSRIPDDHFGPHESFGPSEGDPRE
ncbi:YihY/virulence factor BrkB family protein [Nocardioides baekrokdamisoli]|nr:YihY/virulence factor BrkB family protein [Nocardioides baekrokdamisoli]